ncbi:MAG: hypothetical protein IK100_03450 [Muribaculaceae bacterium]|nr:hypothetical protein [Muribaculaceae bacterium]
MRLRLANKYLYLSALMVAIAFWSSFTADAKVYTWDKYDIAFDAPEGGHVPFSFFQDPSSAQVNWDEMVMTLQRYVKNENTNKKNLEERLKSRAIGFNMYETKMMKIKVKGFKSHALEGTMPDGTRCIIAYLVSEKTSTVLEIVVNYLYGNQEAVEEMIKSFSEGNNQKPNEREKPKQKIQKKKDADKEKEEIEKEKKRKNEKTYEC